MRKLLVVLCLIFCIGAVAQDKPKEQPATVASALDRDLTNLEKEFVPLTEAMPEDKFEFAPTSGEFKGVRTFAQQAKHVAATNFVVAAGLLQEKPKVDPKLENGPDDIKTKADVVKFLKDSFAEAHKAIALVNKKNVTQMLPNPFAPDRKMARLGMATIFTWHGYDHYGQMVVYLRMNGIIPPASRQ